MSASPPDLLEILAAQLLPVLRRLGVSVGEQQNPRWLSIPTVAKRLDCTPTHVRNLITAGELRTINIGSGEERSAPRVSRDSLASFERRREALEPTGFRVPPRRASPQTGADCA